MSYSEKKITQAEIDARNVKSAPDVLVGNAGDNKQVFDRLPEYIVEKYNSLMDDLDGTQGDIDADFASIGSDIDAINETLATKADNVDFAGATATEAGEHGLVPPLAAGNRKHVLFGSGQWHQLDIDAWQNDSSVNVGLTTDKSAGGTYIRYSTASIPVATPTQPGAMSATDKSKLDNIASGAEANVQPDWNQANTSADDYIKNKPTIVTPADLNTAINAEQTARQQADADLKSDLDSITEETSSEGFDESDNLVDGLTLSTGYYENSGGVVNNSNFSHLDIDLSNTTKVKIDGTHHSYTTSQFNALGVFKDSNNNYVTSIAGAYGSVPTSLPYEINVPANATKLCLNTDYKASDYPSSLPSGLYVYPWRTNVEAIKVPYSALEKTPVALADLSDGDKKIKIIAGVIRNSGNGWEYINDSGHEPLNLTNISVNTNGQIVIDYGFTASKVLSLVATPDETFAKQYLIGGSVGLDKTLFDVYALPKVYGGFVTITNNVVDISNSSFTSGSLDTTTGEIKLYHPTLSALLAKEKFNISASAKTYNVSLGSQGNDYVSLFLKDNSGTIIKTFTSANIYVTRFVNSAFINANNIVSADGNFWIYGVMEIQE